MFDKIFDFFVFSVVAFLFFAIFYIIYDSTIVTNNFKEKIAMSFKENRIIRNEEKLDLEKLIYSKDEYKIENIKSYIQGNDENNSSQFLILSLNNLNKSYCSISTSALENEIDEILINNILFLSPHDKRIKRTNNDKLLTFKDTSKFCEVKDHNDVIFIKYLNN